MALETAVILLIALSLDFSTFACALAWFCSAAFFFFFAFSIATSSPDFNAFSNSSCASFTLYTVPSYSVRESVNPPKKPPLSTNAVFMLFKASSITLICSGVEVLNSGDLLNSCNCFFTCCNCFLVTLLISPKIIPQFISSLSLLRSRFANASSHSFWITPFPPNVVSLSIAARYFLSMASFFWENVPYFNKYSFMASSRFCHSSIPCLVLVFSITSSYLEVLTLTVESLKVCFLYPLIRFAFNSSSASNFSFSAWI